MLSEKIIFALNDVNNSYLEEARQLLYTSVISRKHINKSIIRTFLIAAILVLLMAATAYAIFSIHQQRQQTIRENLKIEENHVAGYQEFEEIMPSEGIPSIMEVKEPSVQLISTFTNGEFVDVYFSISPISREESWDAIGWDHKNAIYVIGSNSSQLDDAYRKIGDEARSEYYVRFPVLPPIQLDENLQGHETREELLEKYYDADTQSLMLKTKFLLNNDSVDWREPVYLNVKIIELASLATSFDEPIEEYWARYNPVCICDYGTVPMSISDTESISADFKERNISVHIPSSDKVLYVLGVKIYASEVEWQITHEDVDLIYNLPRDNDEAFHRGYEKLLEWLSVYDEVLDGSTLLLEDGTQIKLNPSESSSYDNAIVTLHSYLGTTIDLRKIDAISILGKVEEIPNPFSRNGDTEDKLTTD